MTVKELRELLAKYPDEMEVFALRESRRGWGCGEAVKPVLQVCFDQDTNKGSLGIYPEVDPKVFELPVDKNFC